MKQPVTNKSGQADRSISRDLIKGFSQKLEGYTVIVVVKFVVFVNVVVNCVMCMLVYAQDGDV